MLEINQEENEIDNVEMNINESDIATIKPNLEDQEQNYDSFDLVLGKKEQKSSFKCKKDCSLINKEVIDDDPEQMAKME